MSQDRDVTAQQRLRGDVAASEGASQRGTSEERTGAAQRDIAVLVPAAGLGTRLGPGAPKALRTLGGASLLDHALRRIRRAQGVGCVVVAAPPAQVAEVAAQHQRDEEGDPEVEFRVVAGGATRVESVAAALAAVPSEFPIILVHDAARSLAPPELFERVAQAVRSGHDAVIPVLHVIDTIKQIDTDGYVVATPERSGLRAVQTPQGFRREVLESAHRAGVDPALVTDDAMLVERLGVRVFCVAGSEAAMKITRPDDLTAAERLLGSQLA